MEIQLEKAVKRSYRMENIGTGLYRGLAGQQKRRNPDLSRQLAEFARQEAVHGRLFRQFARDKFGRRLLGGVFWRSAGRLAALLMRPMPLRKKLKKIHATEQDAVIRIEALLNEELDPAYRRIMQSILPHERAHAALYEALFGTGHPMPAGSSR